MTEPSKSTVSGNVELVVGFPETLRREAAELYWEAFERKLGAMIGPRQRGVAVLERALNPERAVAAVSEGQLVGLAGFYLGGSSFSRVRLRHLVAEFGRLGGAIRMVPLALFDRRPREGELLLDGLAVRADWRGFGVGRKLLQRVFCLARENGLGAVCLDVVDTNPRARLLYEREGFVPIRTKRTPYLRRVMGFSAYTNMLRPVHDDPYPPIE